MKKLPKTNIDIYKMSSLFNKYEDDDGFVFFNILKRINLNADNLDDYEIFEPYVIKPGDSYTNIAYKYYGNINVWWVICTLNKIDNPFVKPTIGSRIYLLRLNYMSQLLDQLSFANG